MAINTIFKSLSIAPTGIPTVVRLSQNEDGRDLTFTLSEAVPSGSTVVIAGTKPDGAVYSAVGTLDDTETVTITEDTQLTAVAGEWEAKVTVTYSGETVATGRIRFIVDADPYDPDATASSSQLQGLVAQCQAYASFAGNANFGAPYPAATAADMTDTDKIYVYLGSEAGYNNGEWYYYDSGTSTWLSGGTYGAGGNAAISDDIKAALLQIAQKVAYIDEDGQDYYDALYDALYPPANLVSISAVYTQGGTVYDTDSLDDLKSDLVVTAYWDDSTTSTVASADYTLGGTLTEGLSTITVTYGGQTATFNVTVTEAPPAPIYNWDFTQSLVDTISNETASLQINATQSSAGITFASKESVLVLNSNNQIDIRNKTIEFDVSANSGEITGGEFVHNRLFGVSPVAGNLNQSTSWMFACRQNQNTYDLSIGSSVSWLNDPLDSTIYSRNFFIGKTVKIYIDNDGYVTVSYGSGGTFANAHTFQTAVDGTNAVQTGYISIGSNSSSNLRNLVVTGARIYNGQV